MSALFSARGKGLLRRSAQQSDGFSARRQTRPACNQLGRPWDASDPDRPSAPNGPLAAWEQNHQRFA